METKIIFIIGMHRCGTSLLANCLVENGFSIGKTKNVDKNWQNPNGYYENDAFHNLHKKLLLYNNCNWSNINKNKMKYTKKHIEEYRNLLKTEFKNEKLILIKDPRLTFFTDFLVDVCDKKYQYNFLFLIRNKEECCNSLSKAQNITTQNCENLYDITIKQYKSDFLKLDHHNILFDNQNVMKKISKFCNINLNKNTTKLIDIKLYRNRIN